MYKKDQFTVLRRVYVTLVEMLIVIAILALFTGLIGINVVKANREQKFQSEVAKIVSKMRLAQDLMLLHHDNVKLIFTGNSRDGYSYILQSENELQSAWKKQIFHLDKLYHVRSITFTDLNDSKILSSDTIVLQFWSAGSQMSRGILRLAIDEKSTGSMERFICLPGYVASIHSVSSLSSADVCVHSNDPFFNEQLTQRTREELQISSTDESPDEE